MKPRPGGENAGGASADDAPFPMEVQPSTWDIPPHEHRYVTVYFAPRAIQTYSAVFEANVEGRDWGGFNVFVTSSDTL